MNSLILIMIGFTLFTFTGQSLIGLLLVLIGYIPTFFGENK